MRASSACCLALAALLPGLAAAESSSAEQQLRDQLRQTTLQLREMQDENAALKARQATLDAQLATQAAAAAPPKPAVDEKQLAAARGALHQQAEQLQQAQQQLDQAKTLLAQWQQAYQQAADTARARDEAAKKYQALYQQSDSDDQSCSRKNTDLVRIGNELLDRYEHKGVFEAVGDGEPFTGLHRVQLEKLAQDYHHKIVDDTLPQQPAPATEDKP